MVLASGVIEIESQEPHERQSVSDLMLRLIIRQIIEGLKNEAFEHQYGIKGGRPLFFCLEGRRMASRAGRNGLPSHIGSKRF